MQSLQDGKGRTQTLSVSINRTLALALTSLAIEYKTSKDELVQRILSDNPDIKREIKEIESEPKSVAAASEETINELQKRKR
jgi:hypothetical protein